MKILLTSTGFYAQKVKEKFLSMTTESTQKYKVGIITTASPEKEHNMFAIKAKTDFLSMGFTNIEFIDIEFDNPDKLLDKDIIYINGGNPFHLLFHIRNNHIDYILKNMQSKNTIIIGVSAGALIFCPNIKIVDFFTPQLNDIGLKDLSSLKFTDSFIFPHYGREDLFPDDENKSIDDRIEEFETLENCSVQRMNEKQWKYINL
ncbi:Type 1 glutamine amidotransferase-like domain-containing protein [Corticicoccus populi]|uniref:Type 1 glutamine amidotransferase-like domain-containing protein n=1 Tax=Corticicoccus populi TaxID=1812821 RepID=A0ABW5WVZ7_9STAP